MQVLDADDYHNFAPKFAKKSGKPSQKFKLNKDGTISMNADPSLVLGCEGGFKVKMVKLGSPDQLIFDELPDYIQKIEEASEQRQQWTIWGHQIEQV